MKTRERVVTIAVTLAATAILFGGWLAALEVRDVWRLKQYFDGPIITQKEDGTSEVLKTPAGEPITVRILLNDMITKTYFPQPAAATAEAPKDDKK